MPEADLKREPLDHLDRVKIAEAKMIIRFEPGSLYELEDPVPYETRYAQGLRYTTLGELREATTTDDIF